MSMSPAIERGQPVVVRDAFGSELPRIATSAPTEGYDFPVVWACREEEWRAATSVGREPDSTPWPVEDVFAREPVA